MNVLLVSHTYTDPGFWNDLEELARKVHLSVLTPCSWNTDVLNPIGMVQRYQGGLWKHHALPAVWSGREYRYFFNPLKLAEVLRSVRPQIVHVAQEPESLSFLQLSLLKPLCGYRLVFSTWENVNPLWPGWLQRQANLRLADAGLAGNRAALERSRRHGFRKPMTVLSSLWGFAIPEQPVPQRHGQPFVIGFAGRLVAQKGLDILVQAARNVPGSEVLIAGNGPLAGHLRAEPVVRLMGPLPRTDMDHFWRSIDVLVLPSVSTPTSTEQFGRVLAEGMAAGVAVVGSDSGAIPEVIGDAGLVVPEGNAAALAGALMRLRDDAVLRAELAQRGRQRATGVYSRKVVAGRLAAFYESIAGGTSF